MDQGASHLAFIDWLIILLFIAASIAIGVILSRRGRKSVREYFTSGNSTSWWLLGTSMVATSFAADTPLTLSGWVVTSGVAQNWFWWCQAPVTMLGVFFIAVLWRRANLVTDNEFVDLRYSGKSAAALRGFKGLFFALVYNAIVMGWVNLAMTKIVQLTLPNIPRVAVVDEAMLWTYLHTPLSDELPAGLRTAMREGKVDPLDLYYARWALNQRPERVAVFRELDTVFRRVAFIETSRHLPAEGGKRLDAAAQAEQTQRFTEYLSALQSGPFLARVGLETQEPEMAATWTAHQPRTPDAIEAPAALQLLYGINQAVSGVNKFKILVLLFLIVMAYTVISGLWGVLVTDFIQFWIAMAGCIVLAVYAVRAAGGMDVMLQRMAALYTPDRARGMVSMIPVSGAGDLELMPWAHFAVFVLFSWYVVQYTDGGTYMAQRMLAAKDERHAALGYLWYGIAHYCLRMWPWIIVGFAAAVMFPFTRDAVTGVYPPGSVAEEGYVRVMLAVLPAGLLGLMLAAFLAAYMSTIATHLNLGASYLVNDFYRPFVRRGASERHYVFVSQVSTVIMAGTGLVISLFYSSISDAWFFLGTLSAGIGAIYLLRWFWWRVNAWTEITCLGVLLLYCVLSKVFHEQFQHYEKPYPVNLLYLVPYSVGLALVVTLLTPTVAREKLYAFVRKVQPGGPGWRRIEDEMRRTDPGFRSRSTLTWTNARRWVVSVAAIYCVLFGSGKLVVGDALTPHPAIPNRWIGAGLLLVGVILGWRVARMFSEKRWAETEAAGA